jgi:hypothetical protein
MRLELFAIALLAARGALDGVITRRDHPQPRR